MYNFYTYKTSWSVRSMFIWYWRELYNRIIIGFVTRLARRVQLMEQELLTLPEHLSSRPVFSGVRVTRSLVLCVCFVCHFVLFNTPVLRRAVLCDWVWRAAGRPHMFPHNNFSSVYRIYVKPGHLIPLWQGNKPIYFGVIRSKVKVTVSINRMFDNRVVSAR